VYDDGSEGQGLRWICLEKVSADQCRRRQEEHICPAVKYAFYLCAGKYRWEHRDNNKKRQATSAQDCAGIGSEAV
jgi:hypothetical protein